MFSSMMIDIVFLAIILGSIFVSASRGAFKAISGLLGTVLGCVGAFKLLAATQPYIEKIITPFVRMSVTSVAKSAGVDSVLNSQVTADIMGFFGKLLEALHMSPELSAKLQQQAGEAGEKMIDAATSGVCAQIAPIITFVLIFILVRLAVALICRLLSFDIPVIRTINKLGGALLGLLSGIIIVLALSWGVMRFAPADEIGFISRPALQQSKIGGTFAKLFESPPHDGVTAYAAQDGSDNYFTA